MDVVTLSRLIHVNGFVFLSFELWHDVLQLVAK